MSDCSANTKPPRVLHVGKYFPPHPGGMETYLRDLMSVQHRNGLLVNAIAHSSKATLSDERIEVGALDGTTFTVHLVARWFTLGFAPISPMFALSAAKVVRAFCPDVLHIHLPNASLIWLSLFPIARRIPWVVHWHSDVLTPDSSRGTKISYAFYRVFERWVLNRASVVLVTSLAYLQHSSVLKQYAKKCIVIPLGLDGARLPDARQTPSLPHPEGPLICYVGRLAHYKGLTDLLTAINMLPNASCWIAGEGEEQRSLIALISEYGLEDRVRLLGTVTEEQKWAILNTADVVVLPSNQKTEAFGLVLLEAAHFGKPLVVRNIVGSGVPWVAAELGDSFCATSQSADSLVVAIEQALIQVKLKTLSHRPRLPASLNLEDQARDILKQYEACFQRLAP